MRARRERRDALLDALAGGSSEVDALAARFRVSPSTIRRDLHELSARGAVARTYGGAILAAPEREASLRAREATNRAAKAAIATAALAEVREGETLLLDGGSTVEALGRLLRGRRQRVVTNNLSLVPVLAGERGIDLVLLGGAVRPISMSTTGPLAEDALRRMTVHRLFTSADGVVAERGLCEATLEQASLKTLMARQAAEVVILADASKLGRAGQPFWTPLRPGWTLVTDAPEASRVPFAEAGLRIVPALTRV